MSVIVRLDEVYTEEVDVLDDIEPIPFRIKQRATTAPLTPERERETMAAAANFARWMRGRKTLF